MPKKVRMTSPVITRRKVVVPSMEVTAITSASPSEAGESARSVMAARALSRCRMCTIGGFPPHFPLNAFGLSLSAKGLPWGNPPFAPTSVWPVFFPFDFPSSPVVELEIVFWR
ncbi:unnamed protein product [Phytomonas sp. Hart1]|nr:unnamed protein product [Phytomonas sp. Hart1]|eukprot:CCW68832.1 unnamed protein product [Phytomonas sp. isolate Hart1]